MWQRLAKALFLNIRKDLPAGDPTKVNFRFYVVQAPSKWKEALHDAASTAGGVIYVPDNALAMLDNEAQLAALLSNCIAVTLEKQFYVHRTRGKIQNDIAWAGALTGLEGLPLTIGNNIAASRLTLQINELASRIGLRYMLASGYDIREAPFAWMAAANEKVENPLLEGDVLPPLARSVMSDLYYDYGSVDYSKLTAGRNSYQKMLAELRAAAPKLPKSKNYPDGGKEVAKR
jgi:hypothetical protein